MKFETTLHHRDKQLFLSLSLSLLLSRHLRMYNRTAWPFSQPYSSSGQAFFHSGGSCNETIHLIEHSAKHTRMSYINNDILPGCLAMRDTPSVCINKVDPIPYRDSSTWTLVLCVIELSSSPSSCSPGWTRKETNCTLFVSIVHSTTLFHGTVLCNIYIQYIHSTHS